MARSEEENRAITDKIAYLINIEGLRPDRATAAAFRMYREGELEIPKPEKKIPASQDVEQEFKREQRAQRRRRTSRNARIQKEFAKMLKNLLKN